MRDVLLASDCRPTSELVVPVHHVSRAKFAAIDAHNHLPVGYTRGLPAEFPRMHEVDLGQMVREMDLVNVEAIVNLSGGTGDELKRSVEVLDSAYPERFLTFCNLDWAGVGEHGWIERATAQLEADVRAGARGLKIFKALGLRVRDDKNRLVMPDDPRIADVWDKAAELGIPVLIHTADPVAFFRPLDRFNERWDELHHHPGWHFYGPEFPPSMS